MSFQFIWDFDNSLIDENTDTYIIKTLDSGIYQCFIDTNKHYEWNIMMDMSMGWLYAGGYTIDDIKNGFKDIPIDIDTINVIKKYNSLNHKMYIVSDSNTFFINTVLDNLSLKYCFDQIQTNPVLIENGRLRIKPYHNEEIMGPHKCKTCRRNMCKGLIVNNLNLDNNKPIIYLGDGKGDYCPIMKLKKTDYALVRKGYQLHNILNNVTSDEFPIANVYYWENGNDIKNYLDTII